MLAEVGVAELPLAHDVEELGVFSPKATPRDDLSVGEVGYVVTGLKDPDLVKVGDTITLERHGASEPLPGYREVKPMGQWPLPEGTTTVARLLNNAGYRTAIAGKWQLLGAEHYPDFIRDKGSLPEDMGFERHCLWQLLSHYGAAVCACPDDPFPIPEVPHQHPLRPL